MGSLQAVGGCQKFTWLWASQLLLSYLSLYEQLWKKKEEGRVRFFRENWLFFSFSVLPPHFSS